ncbi:MAG TPA: ribosome maturation factor RimP [Polyangiaceae bacterium]|jgi:ribosome maturation factor RimP|nr:ribosome maturation factor RimP [Polyangiaceae bacterium]
MQLGYASLKGLDRSRVISLVEPVLQAHSVDVVELIWRSDASGWVLYLTVERPGTTDPGAGITLDLCADISRDVSATLDVADVMPGRYHLEVGSAGIERTLYSAPDYGRFAGRIAKIKLKEARDGQRVFRGKLEGLDAEGRILLEADGRKLELSFEAIESGRLSFDWQTARAKGAPSSGRERPHPRRAAARDR